MPLLPPSSCLKKLNASGCNLQSFQADLFHHNLEDVNIGENKGDDDDDDDDDYDDADEDSDNDDDDDDDNNRFFSLILFPFFRIDIIASSSSFIMFEET